EFDPLNRVILDRSVETVLLSRLFAPQPRCRRSGVAEYTRSTSAEPTGTRSIAAWRTSEAVPWHEGRQIDQELGLLPAPFQQANTEVTVEPSPRSAAVCHIEPSYHCTGFAADREHQGSRLAYQSYRRSRHMRKSDVAAVDAGGDPTVEKTL